MIGRIRRLKPVARSVWNRSIGKRVGVLLATAVIICAPAFAKTLVFCAPGHPGTTEEAQPTMDAFAAGVASAAGWESETFTAIYFPKGDQGLERLRQEDAVAAMVTLPFYLMHRDELSLRPILQGVEHLGAEGSWSLVAAKGKIKSSVDLAGWKVTGLPAYSQALVQGPILGGWGQLPATTEIAFSARVLSALRKASRGEPVAVLLDDEQVDSLQSLPFGDVLEVVHHSAGLPGNLLCEVQGRLGEKERASLVRGLLAMGDDPDGAALLESIRLVRFDRADSGAIEAISKAAQESVSPGAVGD
jgi:hypothetical protein